MRLTIDIAPNIPVKLAFKPGVIHIELKNDTDVKEAITNKMSKIPNDPTTSAIFLFKVKNTKYWFSPFSAKNIRNIEKIY